MTVTVTDEPGLIEEALALRERVFCGEQGVALDLERDGRDGEATHVVALEDGRLLGTCRVIVDDGVGRLGRLVVDPAARRRGVASELIAETHRAARAAGARRMRLNAQTEAVDLYERAGYQPVGERFFEAGIEHVTMERDLA